MLKPAIAYKEQLLDKFKYEIYSENYTLYVGYPYSNDLPNLDAFENIFRYAIVNDKDEVIGYLAYRYEPLGDCCCAFGLYSFVPREHGITSDSLILGRDVRNKLEELVENHHRVEWRVLSNNTVKKSYDWFCKKHNGHFVDLHDVTKDSKGNYVDNRIYEIINPNH